MTQKQKRMALGEAENGVKFRKGVAGAFALFVIDVLLVWVCLDWVRGLTR